MSGTDAPIVTCACASKRAEPLRGFSGGNQPRATGTGEDARRMGFSERTRRTRSPPRGTAPRAARSPRTAPPRPSRTRARRAPRRARRRRRPHPRLGARGLSARRPGGRRTASRRTRPGTRRARRRTPRASRASPRGGRDPRRGVSGRQAATARACLRLSRTTRETAPRRPSERRSFSVGCDDRTRGRFSHLRTIAYIFCEFRFGVTHGTTSSRSPTGDDGRTTARPAKFVRTDGVVGYHVSLTR